MLLLYCSLFNDYFASQRKPSIVNIDVEVEDTRFKKSRIVYSVKLKAFNKALFGNLLLKQNGGSVSVYRRLRFVETEFRSVQPHSFSKRRLRCGYDYNWYITGG